MSASGIRYPEKMTYPGARDRDRRQHPEDRVVRERAASDDPERDGRHGEGDERAQREGREVVGGVGEDGMDGAEEALRERALPDLGVHLPADPGAGELADDERRQEVRRELLLAVAADGGLARDLGPERQHDERHVGGEDPDEELAAVRERRGEADAKERGHRA
jgi:hypothetical protein